MTARQFLQFAEDLAGLENRPAPGKGWGKKCRMIHYEMRPAANQEMER